MSDRHVNSYRKSFETWAKEHVGQPDLSGYHGTLGAWRYNHNIMDLAWRCWQAARSNGPSQKGVLVPFDLWDNIEDFIQGQVDVRDGADGPRPNRAMHLFSRIEQEVK